MPRRALLLTALLLVLGILAWWIWPKGDVPTPDSDGFEARIEAAAAQQPAAPESILDLPTSESAPVRAEATDSDESMPSRFRGRLHVVKGELAIPPTISLITAWAPDEKRSSRRIALSLPDLHFECPAYGEQPRGSLNLPDHLRAVAVTAGEINRSGDVILVLQADEVVIDVEVLPHFAVQFLHEPSGEPLALAEVQVVITQIGGTNWSGRKTDAEGMLFLKYQDLHSRPDAQSLHFVVTQPPEIGSTTTAPVPLADLRLLPQPHLVRIASTLRLKFLVLGVNGEVLDNVELKIARHPHDRPITWHMLNALDTLRDEARRLVVAQTEPPAETVLVSAPKHLPMETAIATEALEGGQQIVLMRATRLSIRGTEQPDEGWESMSVSLSIDGDADGSRLPSEHFVLGRATTHGGFAGSSASSHPTHRKRSLRASLSSGGTVVVDGMMVDTPATVIVHYLGAKVYEELVPMQPGDEEHEVRIPPLEPPISIHGFAVTPEGAPLEGITVTLRDDRQRNIVTGADGGFELGVVPMGSSVFLVLRGKGRALTVIEHRAQQGVVESCGRIVMESDRQLLVRVLDAHGNPFIPTPGTKGERFHVRIRALEEEVQPKSAASAERAANEWLFEGLPAAEVLIEAASAWAWEQRVSIRHDTATPTAIITLSQEVVDVLNSSI